MRLFARPFLFLALLLVGGCSTDMIGRLVEPPQVSLVNFELLDSTALEQRYRFTLRFRNTNPFPLPMSGFTFDLGLNGRTFASGANNRATLIPMLGEEVVVVDASTSLLQVARILFDLPGRDSIDYALDGQAFVERDSSLRLRFGDSGSLSLPRSGGSTRYEHAG
ncbi:MAG: hypothetical protein HKM95_12615 [Inquilinus sp.]|nr:hypothetical protein [Inquilinus sp.]